MTKNLKKKSGLNKIITIIVLFLLLLIAVKALNSVHDFAREVKQRSQFFIITGDIEFFNSEYDEYPPSDRLDPNGVPYCGAMKLAEAMVGQNLEGFHPDSVFRSDGKDSSGDINLYDSTSVDPNLRKGLYLKIENANAYRMEDIFADYGNFSAKSLVLTDVFDCVTHNKMGTIIGMPILYYKADITKKSHDMNNPDNSDNIYNYKDNYDLLALGVPGKPGVKHPLYEDPSLFYIMTQNTMAKPSAPYNKDTYILISAGQDGLYGTSDDIANFDFKWRPKK